MATSKKADIKAAQKRNETALKGFPKAKLKAAFDTMSGKAGEADASQADKQKAGFDILKLARSFRESNADVDVKTVVDGWRDHLKGLTLELAVAGNRFATMTEAKENKPAVGKLTGYGNNVASIAKGVIEFDVVPDEITDDTTGDASYRSVRSHVEGLREQARREADPKEAALQDAKAAMLDAWNDLRKVCFEARDSQLIDQVTDMIKGLNEDVSTAISGAESEAEAEQDDDDEVPVAA